MEKYELVNQDGNKTGKILNSIEVNNPNNIPDGFYLSVVGVVIINKNNEILLQKRSKLKRANPGKWGICGGKVNFGESTLDAGIRETSEEIGVTLNKYELEPIRKSINGKGYFTVYYVRKNVDINKCTLRKEELEELKYFKIEELQNLDNEGFEWLEDLRKIL